MPKMSPVIPICIDFTCLLAGAVLYGIDREQAKWRDLEMERYYLREQHREPESQAGSSRIWTLAEAEWRRSHPGEAEPSPSSGLPLRTSAESRRLEELDSMMKRPPWSLGLPVDSLARLVVFLAVVPWCVYPVAWLWRLLPIAYFVMWTTIVITLGILAHMCCSEGSLNGDYSSGGLIRHGVTVFAVWVVAVGIVLTIRGRKAGP